MEAIKGVCYIPMFTFKANVHYRTTVIQSLHPIYQCLIPMAQDLLQNIQI